MQSVYFRSLGAEAATQDEGLFWTYWSRVKGYMTSLLALPARIRGLRQEALGAKILADARGLREVSSTLATSTTTLSGMLAKAEDVAAKIARWLPKWREAAGETGTVGTLGLAPLLIIGVVGMAALATATIAGMSLLKEYALQKSIIDGAKAKIYSITEAQQLIKAGAAPTFAETTGEAAKAALMPIGLAVAGVVALLAWQQFGRRGARA